LGWWVTALAQVPTWLGRPRASGAYATEAPSG
jgi:hypothetical protein